MCSKFSVLSNFVKYSKIKQNELRHLLKCECRRRMIHSRSFIAKNETNVMSRSQRYPISPTTCFKIARNMSSSNKSDEGNGHNTENDDRKKKSQIRKKKIFQRRLKFKNLKSQKFKNIKQLDINNEGFRAEANIIQENNLPFKIDKGILKVQDLGPISEQNIAQSQLLSKKLYIEFMESQNLKDFTLMALQSSTADKGKQIGINIKTEPTNPQSDQETLSIKPSNETQALITLEESKNVKESNLDFPEKENLKSKDMNAIKDQGIGNAVTTNENFELPAKSSLYMSFFDEINKKDGDVRIIYQAHPKRERKTKLLKLKKSQEMSQIKLPQQHEQNQGIGNDVNTNKNSLSPGKNSLQKPLSNEISKMSESIRILRQENPNRKLKVKIPKSVKSQLILPQQQEQDTHTKVAGKSSQPLIDAKIKESKSTEIPVIKAEATHAKSTTNLNQLLIHTKIKEFKPTHIPANKTAETPTNVGEQLSQPLIDTKIKESKSTEIPANKTEATYTKSIKNLYKLLIHTKIKEFKPTHIPANKTAKTPTKVREKLSQPLIHNKTIEFRSTQIPPNKAEKTPTKFLGKISQPLIHTEIKEPKSTQISANKTEETSSKAKEKLSQSLIRTEVEDSKSKQIADKNQALLSDTLDYILKTKETINKVDKFVESYKHLDNTLKQTYLKSNKWDTNSIVGQPKFFFGEFKVPETIKDATPKLSKNSTIHNQGTAISTRSELAKYKRSSSGGNSGGSSRGEDGKKKGSKARPSKFWRTVSLTLLPFIFGIAVYAISNVGAVEMFKRMNNARSTDDPVPIGLVPAIYENSTNTKDLDLYETESEEDED